MPRKLLTLSVLAWCLVVTHPWVHAQSPAAERLGSLPGPLFPADNWWNQDLSSAPVDARSAQFIAFINNGGARGLHPDFGGFESPGKLLGIDLVARAAESDQADGAPLRRGGMTRGHTGRLR